MKKINLNLLRESNTQDIYQVFWVSSDYPTCIQWAVSELSTDKVYMLEESEEKQAFLAKTDKKAFYTKT